MKNNRTNTVSVKITRLFKFERGQMEILGGSSDPTISTITVTGTGILTTILKK